MKTTELKISSVGKETVYLRVQGNGLVVPYTVTDNSHDHRGKWHIRHDTAFWGQPVAPEQLCAEHQAALKQEGFGHLFGVSEPRQQAVRPGRFARWARSMSVGGGGE